MMNLLVEILIVGTLVAIPLLAALVIVEYLGDELNGLNDTDKICNPQSSPAAKEQQSHLEEGQKGR